MIGEKGRIELCPCLTYILIKVYRSMNNKRLGISVLVALVEAFAVLTPTLLSHESNIVYAQELQQTPEQMILRNISQGRTGG